MSLVQRNLLDRVLLALTDQSTLGVDPSQPISSVELKRAYRQAAFLLHPDKLALPEAADAFQKLNGAYERLLQTCVAAEPASRVERSGSGGISDQTRPCSSNCVSTASSADGRASSAGSAGTRKERPKAHRFYVRSAGGATRPVGGAEQETGDPPSVPGHTAQRPRPNEGVAGDMSAGAVTATSKRAAKQAKTAASGSAKKTAREESAGDSDCVHSEGVRPFAPESADDDDADDDDDDSGDSDDDAVLECEEEEGEEISEGEAGAAAVRRRKRRSRGMGARARPMVGAAGAQQRKSKKRKARRIDDDSDDDGVRLEGRGCGGAGAGGAGGHAGSHRRGCGGGGGGSRSGCGHSLAGGCEASSREDGPNVPARRSARRRTVVNYAEMAEGSLDADDEAELTERADRADSADMEVMSRGGGGIRDARGHDGSCSACVGGACAAGGGGEVCGGRAAGTVRVEEGASFGGSGGRPTCEAGGGVFDGEEVAGLGARSLNSYCGGERQQDGVCGAVDEGRWVGESEVCGIDDWQVADADVDGESLIDVASEAECEIESKNGSEVESEMDLEIESEVDNDGDLDESDFTDDEVREAVGEIPLREGREVELVDEAETAGGVEAAGEVVTAEAREGEELTVEAAWAPGAAAATGAVGELGEVDLAEAEGAAETSCWPIEAEDGRRELQREALAACCALSAGGTGGAAGGGASRRECGRDDERTFAHCEVPIDQHSPLYEGEGRNDRPLTHDCGMRGATDTQGTAVRTETQTACAGTEGACANADAASAGAGIASAADDEWTDSELDIADSGTEDGEGSTESGGLI